MSPVLVREETEVKCIYLYWITLSGIWAVLPRGPVKATPHGSNVTTGGNRSTRRKPAMFGRVKLDNTLLTCDQGNFNQITARSQNQTQLTGYETRTLPMCHRRSSHKFERHTHYQWASNTSITSERYVHYHCTSSNPPYSNHVLSTIQYFFGISFIIQLSHHIHFILSSSDFIIIDLFRTKHSELSMWLKLPTVGRTEPALLGLWQ